MSPGYRYSRWDGTQAGFEPTAEDVLAEMADDLVYHGDVHAALRRMLQSGLRDGEGREVQGLRELLEQVRRRRQEELARFKDMLAALNHMLGQRARGEEPDFDGFMERFGDFFPGRPQTLDELVEQLAAQMAAGQALLDSMTPEQRAELRARSQELLDDLDLRWQIDQLGRHLEEAFPDLGQDEVQGQGQPLSGADLGDLVGGAQLTERFGQLGDLENLLRSATSPGALAEADLDVARDLLGDAAAADIQRLAEMARRLEEAGLIGQKEGRYELTPRGLRRIGQRALADLFGRLDKDRFGAHDADRTGPGHERTYESKPYEYGDPFHLDIERTIRNAVSRSGQGVPVRLDPVDFEVGRTEARTRTSTVLLLDLSLSMPMRENFLAAKKMAMALHALISSRFPQDYLGIVGFSEVARALRPEDLPEVSWDFVYGTNMEHALLLARRLLARQTGTRQVMMVTDGEPTAHLVPGGGVFFHYPPARETVDATLAEVARCTAEGIRINTFVLDATDRLEAFVERLARINRGRVFMTTPATLGSYVLVDFLEQKRALRRRPA
ncbi:MAG: VWA domain-containing protein [Acidimicrobiales bacterium]|nr:hypothetical protein [Actinomycetota bacterium]